MKTYIEITNDKGWKQIAHARDNAAEYILTSARMHDLYDEYVKRYDNLPTAAWYHRHARFSMTKQEPIYAAVRGDQVVGGPYPNRRLAESDCYEGEEVIEVLPSDQGYEEFKSYLEI